MEWIVIGVDIVVLIMLIAILVVIIVNYWILKIFRY